MALDIAKFNTVYMTCKEKIKHLAPNISSIFTNQKMLGEMDENLVLSYAPVSYFFFIYFYQGEHELGTDPPSLHIY